MKTDKEIKKEFSVWCSVHSNSIGRLQEIDSSNISDFWLSKFHTLQEEYKKQIDTKMLAFFAKYSIDRPIPPSEIRAYWDKIIS